MSARERRARRPGSLDETHHPNDVGTNPNETPVANAIGRLVATTSHTGAGDFTSAVTGYGRDGDPMGTRATWPASWTGGVSGTASATVSYGYNDASQVTSTRYGAVYGMGARTVSHRYAENGLLERITTDGGVTLGRATYNRRNQPTGLESAAAGSGSVSRGFSWQPETGYLDVLTAAVDTGDTLRLAYGYDVGGNVTAIRGRSVLPATATDPTPTMSGAWCYTYDGLNRLTTARTGSFDSADDGCGDGGGHTAFLGAKHHLGYGYTRDGLRSVTDLSSSATATYGYPESGDPAGSGGVGRPVHGVTAISQTGNDPNKLMPLPGGNGGETRLVYDPAGRVTQLTRAPGAAEAGSGAKNVTDWYAYDDLGNLVTQTTAPAADVAPTDGERTVTEGAFDVDGIRVMRRVSTTTTGKKTSTVTTVFLGDTEVTFEPDTLRRTLTRSHTTPGGVPVASEEVVTDKNKTPGATGLTWLVADQQHSIRLTRGPQGVKRTAYLPYGTPLGYGTNPSLAPGGRGYLNKTHDPNGDIRLDRRAYQPGLNVLTTPDALLTSYDPQGLNPYAYARNNPIGMSDPSGLNAAPIEVSLNDDDFAEAMEEYHDGTMYETTSVDPVPERHWYTPVGDFVKETGAWVDHNQEQLLNAAEGAAEAALGAATVAGSWTVAGAGACGVGGVVSSPTGVGAVAGGSCAAAAASFAGVGHAMMGDGLNKAASSASELESAPKTANAADEVARALSATERRTLDDALRPEKLDHIFDPKHNFEPLVQQFGSREAAMEQIVRSIGGPLPQAGRFEIAQRVGGQTVVVRGAVVDGIPRIGTAFTP